MLAVTINKILNVSLARVGESVHGTSWFSSKLLATNLDLIFFCPFIILYLLNHLNVIHDCLWKVICSYTSLSLHFFNSFNFAFNRSSLFISLVLIKTYSEFGIGLYLLTASQLIELSSFVFKSLTLYQLRYIPLSFPVLLTICIDCISSDSSNCTSAYCSKFGFKILSNHFSFSTGVSVSIGFSFKSLFRLCCMMSLCECSSFSSIVLSSCKTFSSVSSSSYSYLNCWNLLHLGFIVLVWSFFFIWFYCSFNFDSLLSNSFSFMLFINCNWHGWTLT